MNNNQDFSLMEGNRGEQYVQDFISKMNDDQRIKYDNLRQNPNLTPQQHELLKELSIFRHYLHDFPQSLFLSGKDFNSDSQYTIRDAAMEYFGGLVNNQICEKLGFPPFIEVSKQFDLISTYEGSGCKEELEEYKKMLDDGVDMDPYKGDMMQFLIDQSNGTLKETITPSSIKRKFTDRFAREHDDFNKKLAGYFEEIQAKFGDKNVLDYNGYTYRYTGKQAKEYLRGQQMSCVTNGHEPLKEVADSMSVNVRQATSEVDLLRQEKIDQMIEDRLKDYGCAKIKKRDIQISDPNHRQTTYTYTIQIDSQKNFNKIREDMERNYNRFKNTDIKFKFIKSPRLEQQMGSDIGH